MWPDISPNAAWTEGQVSRTLPFSGHSGARVELLEGPCGSRRVRKQAARHETATRLIEQGLKQQKAFHSGLPCPEVLAWGTAQELPFFEMAYVPGRSLAARILEGRSFHVDMLLPLLERLRQRAESEKGAIISTLAIQNKIAEMARQTSVTARGLGHDGPTDDIFLSLLCLDFSGLEAGWCHGDLTLENILAQPDGRLCLIDFDAPALTGLKLDLAKLYQDLIGHWCIRHLHLDTASGASTANALVKLDDLRCGLDEALRGWPGIDVPQLHGLAAFHLARTLPYMKDQRLLALVLGRIRWLLHHLRAESQGAAEASGGGVVLNYATR